MVVPTPGEQAKAAHSGTQMMLAGRKFERFVFVVSESADFETIDRDADAGERAGLIRSIEVQTPAMIGGRGCRFERGTRWRLCACGCDADQYDEADGSPDGWDRNEIAMAFRPRVGCRSIRATHAVQLSPPPTRRLPEGLSDLRRQVGERGYATLPSSNENA